MAEGMTIPINDKEGVKSDPIVASEIKKGNETADDTLELINNWESNKWDRDNDWRDEDKGESYTKDRRDEQIKNILSSGLPKKSKRQAKAEEKINKHWLKTFKGKVFEGIQKGIDAFSGSKAGSWLMDLLSFLFMMVLFDPSGTFMVSIFKMMVNIVMMFFRIVLKNLPVMIKALGDIFFKIIPEVLLSVIPELIQGMSNLLATLGKNAPEPLKILFNILKFIVEKAEPVLKLIAKYSGFLLTAGLAIVGYTKFIAPFIGNIQKIFLALKGFMTFLIANPIALVLIAVAVAIYLVWKNWEKIDKFLTKTFGKTWTNFKKSLQAVWNTIKGFVQFFSKTWKEKGFVTAVKETYGKIDEYLEKKFGKTWVTIRTFFEGMTKAFYKFFGSFIDAFKQFFDDWGKDGFIKAFGKLGKRLIKAMFQLVSDIFVSLWDTMTSVIGTGTFGWLDNIKAGVMKIFSAVGEFFGSVFSAFTQFFDDWGKKGFWRAFWGLLGNLIKAIWNLFTSLLGAIWEFVKAIPGLFVDLLGLLWKAFKFILEGIGTLFVMIGEGIWNGIKSIGKWAWDGIKSMGTSVVDNLSSVNNWMGDKVKSFGESIFGFFKYLGESIYNGIGQVGTFIKNIPSLLWEAIQNLGTWLAGIPSQIWAWIKEKISSIGGFMSNLLGVGGKKDKKSITNPNNPQVMKTKRDFNKAVVQTYGVDDKSQRDLRNRGRQVKKTMTGVLTGTMRAMQQQATGEDIRNLAEGDESRLSQVVGSSIAHRVDLAKVAQGDPETIRLLGELVRKSGRENEIRRRLATIRSQHSADSTNTDNDR